ncbi:MAG: aspartyl/asparaginyl beta-hydroxylase domain-containing protein [Gemmatimonadaceae bacterium]|nr:aspartyl/asparaginyl beta-hydroxylase domain-containing protein [Gloeobacterales cyanobacterium ES-bin-141]
MFYDARQFAFVSTLESNWSVIRQEVERIDDGDFLAWPEKYLYGKGWDIFGLYGMGIKLGHNCQLCPKTAALLESLPELSTAGFSSLKPGTRIAPHTGYPDGLLRAHLGLLVPENCALRVGAEVQAWQEGKCLVFDDTTEHEAWNHGDYTRIVLLLDFKAPVGLLPQPADKPKGKGLFGFLKR